MSFRMLVHRRVRNCNTTPLGCARRTCSKLQPVARGESGGRKCRGTGSSAVNPGARTRSVRAGQSACRASCKRRGCEVRSGASVVFADQDSRRSSIGGERNFNNGRRRWDETLTALKAHVRAYQGSAVVRANQHCTRPLRTSTHGCPSGPTPSASGQSTSTARAGPGSAGVREDVNRTRCRGTRWTGKCGGRRNPVHSVSIHQARLYYVLFALAEARGGDQQHDHETHNCSPLGFFPSCCPVIPRAFTLADRVWHICAAPAPCHNDSHFGFRSPADGQSRRQATVISGVAKALHPVLLCQTRERKPARGEPGNRT